MNKIISTLEEVSVPQAYRRRLLDKYPPWSGAELHCRAQYKGGWTCTRSRGHEGKHAAHGMAGDRPGFVVLAVWE